MLLVRRISVGTNLLLEAPTPMTPEPVSLSCPPRHALSNRHLPTHRPHRSRIAYLSRDES